MARAELGFACFFLARFGLARPDHLVFAKVAGPAWLRVAADGTLSATPGYGDDGPGNSSSP